MGNAVPKRDCHMDFLETKIYSKWDHLCGKASNEM
jgi:hypothetical protein